MPVLQFISYPKDHQRLDQTQQKLVYSHVGKHHRNRGRKGRAPDQQIKPSHQRIDIAPEKVALYQDRTDYSAPKPLAEGHDQDYHHARPDYSVDGDTLRCLSPIGAVTVKINMTTGASLYFYLFRSLHIAYNSEFYGLGENAVLSHRFFPVLQDTFQRVVTDAQLLDSLLAVNGQFIAATTNNAHYRMLGLQAAHRAIRHLQYRLSNSEQVNADVTVHTVLHLCMAAFQEGLVKEARSHLQGALIWASAFAKSTLFEVCILESLSTWDVYIACELGEAPLMFCSAPAGFNWPLCTCEGSYLYLLPFETPCGAGNVSNTLRPIVLDFMEVVSHVCECRLSQEIPFEARDNSKQLAKFTLHRLCRLYRDMHLSNPLGDQTTQQKTINNELDSDGLVGKTAVLIMQLHLLHWQGPLLVRSSSIVFSRLVECVHHFELYQRRGPVAQTTTHEQPKSTSQDPNHCKSASFIIEIADRNIETTQHISKFKIRKTCS